MQRKTYKKYLILVLALFLLTSAPLLLVQKWRSASVALFAPLTRAFIGEEARESHNERLERENLFLREELAKLRSLLDQQCTVDAFKREGQRYAAAGMPRRAGESDRLGELVNAGVSARVIFRDPSSWASSLWIDLGEADVCKNSPVIVGKSLVGVVDYVGARQSRVRLVTDMGFKPAVRAVRGYPQNALLVEHIEALLRAARGRQDLALDEKGLQDLKSQLTKSLDGSYLAKGILSGSGAPLWRKCSQRLQGVGFNYDFSDEEGPARPLTEHLLRVGDLLVTTGLDGVLPPGLRVAEVTRVDPLREGGYQYSLEALPTAVGLDELQCVWVLPPRSFEDVELPAFPK